MKRKVKVILTAAIFTFCTAIGGCKAVESKLEPVYEALLQEDSVQEEKSVQASENQEMSIRYLVNDLLMNLHGLAPLCIPINKTGSQSRDFPKMVEAGFASDNHIIMFPAGLCSRRQGGEIKDLEWKKTFVVKSIQAKRDVIPVHFGGRNSDFFYNLANVCKALGIKFNIAMLYLADEMFKNRHKTFTVTFGKPIPWQTFDKSKTPAQWAEYVKDIVYKL